MICRLCCIYISSCFLCKYGAQSHTSWRENCSLPSVWSSGFITCFFNPVLYSNTHCPGNSPRTSSGLFRPFTSMCCPSARDRGVAGEAYVLWPCMCSLIRCKMGPWPLCQRPWQCGGCCCLPLRPRLSLSAHRVGRWPLCLEREAGPSRLEGLMPFHAVMHRQQMHCPQTGSHATSSEEAVGGVRWQEGWRPEGLTQGINLSWLL